MKEYKEGYAQALSDAMYNIIKLKNMLNDIAVVDKEKWFGVNEGLKMSIRCIEKLVESNELKDEISNKMKIEKCDICGEELTDVEKLCKKISEQLDWSCKECFHCYDEEYTEHGKYLQLLDFVKSILDKKIYSTLVCIEHARNAEKLLKHIGELG